MIQLFDHQIEAQAYLAAHPKAILAFEPGVGKTLAVLQFIKDHPGNWLVLAPKSTLESVWAADARKVKVIPVIYRDKDAPPPTPDFRLIGSRRLPSRIAITNYEQYIRHAAEYHKAGYDRIVFDECFPAGTMIDTPTGPRAIETLKPGDVINNAAGKDRVTNTFKREVHNAVQVEIRRGDQTETITSSSGHCFFTGRGWCRAKDLRPGDTLISTDAAMRSMQEGVFADRTHGSRTVLRHSLLRHLHDESAGSKGEDSYTKIPCQVQSDFEGDEVETAGEGRKWCGYDEPTKENVAVLGGQMDRRIRNPIGRPEERLSDQLQSGPGSLKPPYSYRDRRSFPLRPQGSGREERGKAIGIRVDRVTLLELGSPDLDRFRHADGKLYFYDLEAARHHSYSIKGCLVHNSSRLKNYKSKISKTVRRYAKHWSHCICLSGTPAPNSTSEYFTQLFAIGSASGGFWEWAQLYHEPVYQYLGIRRVIKGWKLRESTKPAFAAMLGERCWRLKKAGCLDLPPVTHLTRRVDLGPEGMKQYRMARDELKVELSQQVQTIPTYARFMKLRQISSGFLYDSDKQPHWFSGAKIDELMDLLTELGGEPVVVWAEFVAERLAIQDRLRTAGILFQFSEDVESIQKFQSGEGRVFMASPAQCSHGISLTRANHAVYFSKGFSVELHYQSLGRLDRPGQRNPVTIHHLISAHTVDEQVDQALTDKANVAEAVLRSLTDALR